MPESGKWILNKFSTTVIYNNTSYAIQNMNLNKHHWRRSEI